MSWRYNRYRNTTTTSVIPFGSLLFLVFLVLKLCNIGVVGTWSWLWVTSPLWIPIAIILAIALITFLILIIFDR